MRASPHSAPRLAGDAFPLAPATAPATAPAATTVVTVGDKGQCDDISALQNAGPLVRTLAAAHAEGLMLVSGDAVCHLAPFLLQGADMGASVVVNVEDATLAAELRSSLSLDIRCAVHCQERAEFLGDICAHRFDVMLMDYRDAPLTTTAAARLSTHGMLILYTPPPAREIATALSDTWHCTELSNLSLLLVTRAHNVQKRRGGRSRHRARTRNC